MATTTAPGLTPAAPPATSPTAPPSLPPSPSSTLLVGAAFTAAGAILFGSKAVLVKLCYVHAVTPLTVLSLRVLVALPFFVALAWYERRRAGKPMLWRERGACALIGLASYYLASYLDFAALAYLSVGLERMLLFSFPTFVVLGTALMRRRWPAPTVLRCLGITYVGILIAYGGAAESYVDAATTMYAAMLVLAAALVFAGAYGASVRWNRRLGSRRFTATAMTAACMATLLHRFFSSITDQSPEHSTQIISSFSTIPAAVWGYGIALGLGATVVASLCMNEGIRRLGAGRSAIIGSISPIAAIGLAWLALHEVPSPLQALGMVVTIVGATWMSFSRQASSASATSSAIGRCSAAAVRHRLRSR